MYPYDCEKPVYIVFISCGILLTIPFVIICGLVVHGEISGPDKFNTCKCYYNSSYILTNNTACCFNSTECYPVYSLSVSDDNTASVFIIVSITVIAVIAGINILVSFMKACDSPYSSRNKEIMLFIFSCLWFGMVLGLGIPSYNLINGNSRC